MIGNFSRVSCVLASTTKHLELRNQQSFCKVFGVIEKDPCHSNDSVFRHICSAAVLLQLESPSAAEAMGGGSQDAIPPGQPSPPSLGNVQEDSIQEEMVSHEPCSPTQIIEASSQLPQRTKAEKKITEVKKDRKKKSSSSSTSSSSSSDLPAGRQRKSIKHATSSSSSSSGSKAKRKTLPKKSPAPLVIKGKCPGCTIEGSEYRCQFNYEDDDTAAEVLPDMVCFFCSPASVRQTVNIRNNGEIVRMLLHFSAPRQQAILHRIGLYTDAAVQQNYFWRLESALQRRKRHRTDAPSGRFPRRLKQDAKDDEQQVTKTNEVDKMEQHKVDKPDDGCDEEGPWQRAAKKKADSRSSQNQGCGDNKRAQRRKTDKSTDDGKS